MVDSFAICENLCGIFNGIWRTVDPVYSRGPCRFGGGFAGEDPVTCGFNEYYYELQWALDCRINGVGGIDLFPSVRLRYWNSVGGFFSLTNPIPGIAVLPARTLSEGPCSNIFGDYPVSAENWTTDGRPSVYSCYDPPQEAVIEVYPCDAAGDGGEDVEIIL